MIAAPIINDGNRLSPIYTAYDHPPLCQVIFIRGTTTCNLSPMAFLSSQLSPVLGIEPSLHLAHWDIKYLPKPKPLNGFLTAPLVHLRCSLNFTCIISQNLLFVKQNFEDFQYFTTPTCHSKTVSPCPELRETLDLFQHYTSY